MIFITSGTILIPFNRLITSCLEVFSQNEEPLHVQYGAAVLPNWYDKKNSWSFISNQKMIQQIKKARLVISAAGEGSVFQILEHAQNKPILFPRLKKYNEQVDDQQLSIAGYFEEKHLAYCATSSLDLRRFTRKETKNIYTKREANHQLIEKLIQFTEDKKNNEN